MYFLIYALEDGIRIKKFNHSCDVQEYLKEDWPDTKLTFINPTHEDFKYLEYGEMILIKGDVIIPIPVEIALKYDFGN